MPRKTNRNKKRKTYRKRKRKQTISTQLIPLKVMKTFRYSDTITLDPGAGIPAEVWYRANGMYDPQESIGGHQPLGFDQYVGVLYDHFVVVGAKITAIFNSRGSSGSTSTYRVGINPTDTTSDSLPMNTLIEQGRCKWGFCSNVTSTGQKTITMKLNPNKYLGRSHPLSDPDLKGSASADPVEQAYFHIFADAADGAVDAGALTVNLLIEYSAVLIEPKNLTGS